MNKEQYHMIRALEAEGVTYQDAQALRRISMTLHRWHEMECGTDRGASSATRRPASLTGITRMSARATGRGTWRPARSSAWTPSWRAIRT